MARHAGSVRGKVVANSNGEWDREDGEHAREDHEESGGNVRAESHEKQKIERVWRFGQNQACRGCLYEVKEQPTLRHLLGHLLVWLQFFHQFLANDCIYVLVNKVQVPHPEYHVNAVSEDYHRVEDNQYKPNVH